MGRTDAIDAGGRPRSPTPSLVPSPRPVPARSPAESESWDQVRKAMIGMVRTVYFCFEILDPACPLWFGLASLSGSSHAAFGRFSDSGRLSGAGLPGRCDLFARGRRADGP